MMKNESLGNSKLRRKNLIDHMSSLDSKNINCQDCSGLCCTFRKNSMMMTPLEAHDLYQYLVQTNQWNESLVSKLEENIREFRLDYDLSTTRNQNFRRTYTCPFFKHQSYGCPLPIHVKPYGCLAFNPLDETSKEGEGCESDHSALEKREQLDLNEEKSNVEVKENYQLSWDKKPIPVALLEINSRVTSL